MLCVSEEVPIKLNHKCFTDVVPVIPRDQARDSRRVRERWKLGTIKLIH